MLKRLGFFGVLSLSLLLGLWWIERSNYRPKVYDCFLFFNEFDILDIRLSELSDKVDKFILVESTRTFQNKPKPLFFAENKEKYAKYKDRIVHVIVDSFPQFSPVGDQDYWEVEIFQRDRIKFGLKSCRPNKRDIVIITDVDEIIRKEKIDKIVSLIDREGQDLVFGSFDLYRYFFNRKVRNNWPICMATSYENFSKYIRSAEDFRRMRGFAGRGQSAQAFETLEKIKQKHPRKKWSFAQIRSAGWHFSTIGGYQETLLKLGSQSHVSRNTPENRNLGNIKQEIMRDLDFCKVDETFPRYLLDRQEEFRLKKMIDEEETVYQ